LYRISDEPAGIEQPVGDARNQAIHTKEDYAKGNRSGKMWFVSGRKSLTNLI